MKTTLSNLIACTKITLVRSGKADLVIIVNIGDLAAFSSDDEPLDGMPFGDEDGYWSVKCEVLDGNDAPFVRDILGGDSVHALVSALSFAGKHLSSLYGSSDKYEEMMPNYGFPEYS